MKDILEFQGPYRFLSNFWPVAHGVTLPDCPGTIYPTVEQAYQAAKTTDFTMRLEVVSLSPGQAKRWGRRIKVRPDWDVIKVSVMVGLVRQKFAKEPLRGKLLATGNALLVEGNSWGDTFWGVCAGREDNRLGKILMDTREALR